MVFTHCAIVILISVLVNRGIPLSVPEQDKTDLDEYAKEVGRLFDDIPIVNSTSEERVYKLNDSESFLKNTSVNDDDYMTSPPLRIIPEDLSHISGSHESEGSRDVPPFSIDKGIDSSAREYQSQRCVLDRSHITSMFKECIYIQAGLTTTATAQAGDMSIRDYDSRFLKYCRKAPQLRSCVKNLIVSKMEHCLDEGVRDSINVVEEITERIIKFICINESDRISIFISDGGLECLLSTNWRIHLCLSLHLGSHVLLSLFELPSLNLENIRCVNLQSAHRCVARELKLCEDPTSAVVARLLFHIAMEVASCEDTPDTSPMTTTEDKPTTELFRSPSPSNEEQTTGRIGPIDPLISAGLQNVGTTFSGTPDKAHIDHHPAMSSTLNASSLVSHQSHKDHQSTPGSTMNASSLASHQSHKDHQSTPGSTMNAPSVASDKGRLSIPSPELETTPVPPNSLVNATMSSDDNSAATTIGLMCVILVFSVIILISYKRIVKTN